MSLPPQTIPATSATVRATPIPAVLIGSLLPHHRLPSRRPSPTTHRRVASPGSNRRGRWKNGVTLYLKQPLQVFNATDESQRTIGTSREFVKVESGMAIAGSLLVLPTPGGIMYASGSSPPGRTPCRAVVGLRPPP